MRGIKLAALAAALSVALAGCLGPSDEQKIRAAVTGLAEAARARHYGEICERYLSNTLREQIRLVGNCSRLLKKMLGGPGFDPRFRLAVESVEIDGNRATTRVRTTAEGHTTTVNWSLVREGDNWRLATFP